MQYLSVTKDIDGETGLTLLSAKDIIFLRWDSQVGRVIVHTLEDHFYIMGSLKYWTTGLNRSGSNFKIVDRNNAVNVDKIVLVDSVYKKAFFEMEVHDGSKSCTMAFNNFDFLRKELEVINPGIVLV